MRDGYAAGRRARTTAAVGFVMVIFQKLMASSIRALRTSLDKPPAATASSRTTSAARHERPEDADSSRLEERLEDDELVSDLLADLADADADEAAELEHLVELLDAVPLDSKAETLVAQARASCEH